MATFTTEEIINLDYAKYLSSMSLSDFKDLYTSKDKDLKSTHSLMVKTCKQSLTTNPFKRNFDFSKGKDYGRRFSIEGGIQALPKIVRGALCKDITTDIDMCNCHPQILLKLLTDNDFSCPNLKEYCNNRDFVFKKLFEDDGFTRDDAKNAFLKSMNKGSRCNSKTDPKINTFFKHFDKEMKDIQNFLWNLDQYSFIKNDVDTTKGNTRGSFINLILCKYENELLELTINYLQDIGYEINTLCFDGLLIKGNHYENTELIDKLNSLTKNWDIKWSYKPHDTSITIPPNFIYNENSQEDLTEKEYADIFCEQYKNLIVRGDKNSYLVNEFGIYTKITNVKEHVRSILLKDYFHYKFLQKDKNINSVANIINTLLYNPQIDNLIDTTRNILPFDNGVFDLTKKEFRNAKLEEYVCKTFGYDYHFCEHYNVEEILRGLFIPEVGDYAMWKIGRILKGNTDKTFTTMIGSGNNGKTKVMGRCINEAFGVYSNSVEHGLITSERNKFWSNDNKPNPALLCMKDSMINMASELEKGILLSSAKIKKYTGGNKISARQLHSNDVVSFDIRGQLWFDTNTVGEIDEVDDPIIARFDPLPFDYTFVTKINEENPYHKLLKEDPFEGINNIPLEFMNLMIHHYYTDKPPLPQRCIDIKNELLQQMDDVLKFINNCNLGKQYKCPSNNLYASFKQDIGSDLSKKDFKIRMEYRGYKESVLRFDGKSARGYAGIGLIGDEEDEEPE